MTKVLGRKRRRRKRKKRKRRRRKRRKRKRGGLVRNVLFDKRPVYVKREPIYVKRDLIIAAYLIMKLGGLCLVVSFHHLLLII